MKITFKKTVLGTALAASAAVGMLAVATPAEARHWDGDRGFHGGGAIAAGLIGLAAGVAIASDHGPYVEPAPVNYYYAPPVAYAPQASCYYAYPGYEDYCYPASYYVNLGWGWHDGGWWYGGTRYARPFVVGGYRGGYGGGYRGGYVEGGYRGGYRGGYAAGGYRGGYAAPAYHGGYAGGGQPANGGGHVGYAGGAYAGGGRAAYTGGYAGGARGGYAGGGGGHSGNGGGNGGGGHGHR